MKESIHPPTCFSHLCPFPKGKRKHNNNKNNSKTCNTKTLTGVHRELFHQDAAGSFDFSL